MAIGEKIQADIVTAMKAQDEHRLTTLRMVKSALKNKEIDKRAPLEGGGGAGDSDDADQAAEGLGGAVYEWQPAGAGGEGGGGDQDDRGLSPAVGERGGGAARWCGVRSSTWPRMRAG